MQRWMAILWSSFLMAGIAEGVFFSLINPQELYLLGQVVDYPPIMTYSVGFFAFWGLCAASSWLTCYVVCSSGKTNQCIPHCQQNRGSGSIQRG